MSQDLRNYGGLEKWHIQIANMLASRGHEVSVIGINLGGMKRVDGSYIRRIIKFPYTENPALESLPDLESDILYTSIGNKSVLDYIVRAKCATIFGAHHSEYVLYHSSRGIAWGKDILSFNGFKTKVWIRRLLKLLPKFSAVHVTNPILSDWKRYNRNVFVIPNVPMNPESNAPKGNVFTVLFFGRHERIKGTETVSKLAKNLPSDTVLLIAGSGSESERLKAMSSDRVRFLGFLDEGSLADTIASSHLVVFPSHSENNSLILAEALRNGTPVVARRANFNSLLEGKPLCQFASSDEEFIKRIEELRDLFYRDPESYREKSKALKSAIPSASEYVEKFEGMINSVYQTFAREEGISS
ncbi:MAG: glycosyltransferase family 4 protein [Thermoplasmata archaeon]